VELRDYVRVLRRSWLLVLTCVVLGGLLATTATWRATRLYAATLTLVVSSSDGANTASSYQAGLLSEQRVKSYANLVASDRVAAAVVTRLRLAESPEALRGRITAAAVPDTVLMRVSVSDTDPARAKALADAVGDVFADAVARIEAPSADEPPTVRVTVWERAKLPTAPVAPRPSRNLALGILLGLLGGLGAALVRHRLDTTLAGERDAATITGLPGLGAIVFESDAARRPLIVHASPHSQRAEAFRQLRTNLRFVDVDGGPRSILVTSSVPAEGKTTTSCNLAIALAQSGKRVCLVEGDLRRPSFATYLGVESAAGLTSVLIGAAEIDDVLQPWGEGRVGDGRIDVLPCGPVPPNPSELLGSQVMANTIQQLVSRYDTVLIDAPPLLPVTDAAVLASRTDGTLLIARVGRTRREQLRRALESLRTVDARVLGTVLNMVPTKGVNAYDYGGYYGYAPNRGRNQRPATQPRSADGRVALVASSTSSVPAGGPGRSAEPVTLTPIVEQRTAHDDRAAKSRDA
jgi:non-specific protein-tyrosine kinase